MASNGISQHWRDMAQFERGIERKLMLREAKEAEDMGSRDCSVSGCGGKCFYRPGVGGWWCEKCGHLER